MPHARNVGGHFHAVRKADAGNFADGGVRLPRSLRGHFRADAALERRWIKSRTIIECIETACKGEHARLRRFALAPLSGKLIDGGHEKKKTRSGSVTI